MNDFTASNGRRLWKDDDGAVRGEFDAHNTVTYVRPENFAMLAEFFQAEADERIGRWRWPENPDYVVQPFAGGSGWNALCESTCVVGTFLSRDAVINSPSYLAPAVLAYIDAHPEPKPWHDAKPGEVWVLRIANVENEDAYTVTYDIVQGEQRFNFRCERDGARYWTGSSSIVAGRRIWPEVS